MALNGKANRSRIQQRVNCLLEAGGLQEQPLQRLPLHGNIMIKSPADMKDIPFWGYRASGIMRQHLMDGVIQSLRHAEAVGCKPFINPLKKAEAVARKRAALGLAPLPAGGLRSDYEAPFHIGVFKHPNQTFDHPWVTKDTLQGFSGNSASRHNKIAAMLPLCSALDSIAFGPIANVLRQVAPETLQKSTAFATLRRHSSQVQRHDFAQVLCGGSSDNNSTLDPWPYLRFGNLGTCVAIGKGQSEKLHLDVHDDEVLPTVLMIMGEDGQNWDRSQGQGDIVLPTLGLSVPLFPGDVFIFYASLLPHKVKPLRFEEHHMRTVATLFTCGPTRQHLERPLMPAHEQEIPRM